MPKSNISKFASLRIINGRVWVHTLLGLSKNRGDEDAPGQAPEGLRHRFCYPEPDRRVHPNPTGFAVTDGTSSSSPVSIPASFCSTRNAAKAAVRLLAPLPKMCPVAEEAVGGPRLPPARQEDALHPPLAPRQAGRGVPKPPLGQAGDRHHPTEDATARLTLEEPS